jgi:hypothetical protein
MNTKDFLRLGVPLGEATRRPPSFHYGATNATDFVAQFIPGGAFQKRGIYSASTREVVRRWKTFGAVGGRKLKRRERHAPFAKPVDDGVKHVTLCL